MGMPSAWIDRIFDKLTLTYGRAFVDRWKDLDLNAVKSDWMHELDGMERHPEAIAFALSNLNEKSHGHRVSRHVPPCPVVCCARAGGTESRPRACARRAGEAGPLAAGGTGADQRA